MKKKIIIAVAIIALLITGYVVYTKFVKGPSLPTGSRSDLQTKLTALQYKLINDRKAGKDVTALNAEIALYQQALEQSQFTGSIYGK